MSAVTELDRPPIVTPQTPEGVFAPSERYPETPQPQAPAYNPNIYKKIEDVGSSGIPYLVKVLDEQITYISSDGNTVRIRQYLLGHHSTPLLNRAKPHQGWQGDETIREFHRLRMRFGNGKEVITTREIDISEKRPSINSTRWGTPK